ncbi:MAG: hypothetical protein GX558_04265 [Clostridiales bacterium]|nr:hypothetical protein [Clostridiales bacterium]
MDDKIRIILDTDIGPDCDDAAALAIAHVYAAAGRAELAAVMHCTSSPWGVGAIRAINRWYGRDTPVGTLADPGFLVGEAFEKYNRPLSLSLPPSMLDAEDCLPLYRRTLAQAADRSIHIVTIGPLRNLANLLRSAPDEYSGLDGARLIARKVTRLTLMAGRFGPAEGMPEVEWNVEMDVPSAREVAARWPVEMAYCGFELGIRVPTGGRMMDALPAGHPVREAYRLYTGGGNRPSWDLLAVLHAVDPENSGLSDGEPGVVELDERGVTRFSQAPGGLHRRLTFRRPPEQIAAMLDDLLCGGAPARGRA